jgi:hypothetical protein
MCKWRGVGMIRINDSEKIYSKKLRVINRGQYGRIFSR